MKKSYRLLSAILTIIMVVSLLPLNALTAFAAEDTMTVVGSEETAAAGSTVQFTVSLQDNPGISSYKFVLTYDNDLLTLTGVEYNTAMGGQTIPPQKMQSPVTLLWVSAFADYHGDCTAATLTFTVSPDAPDDVVLPITISYDPNDVYNMEETNIPCAVVNGSITVLGCVPGDINGDMVANNKDITRLAQYLGSWDVEVNTPALDTNGDGSVNNKDLTRLMQYLAGWDVEIFPKKGCAHQNVEAITAVEPTCAQEGNIAYWHCTDCGKNYSDAACKTVVALADTVLMALWHTAVIDEAVPATYESTGLTEGSHCSVCNLILVPQEVIPMLVREQHSITYNIANGDAYLASQTIKNPNEDYYTVSEGYTLKTVSVPGYKFLGWYDLPSGENAEIIKKIPAGSTEDIEVYAHWEKEIYHIEFDSPDVPWESVEYTVDKETTLTNPSWFGYTFVGWSQNGKIVTSIPKGTIGNITLHANWTSNRNQGQAKDNPQYTIIDDRENSRYLFLFEIGTINNVPINVQEHLGNTEGINIEREVSYL